MSLNMYPCYDKYKKKVYGNGTCTLLYNVCRNISLYQEIQIISMLNI